MISATAASSGIQPASGKEKTHYVVVKPGTHPGIVLSTEELASLRGCVNSDDVPGRAYQKLKQIAVSTIPSSLTPKEAVGRQGEQLALQLESMALIYRLEDDREIGRRAVALFKVAAAVDPVAFHQEVGENFFATEHWPEAFAFAWDWLYDLMTQEERAALLTRLEAWSAALFAHTESWWWKEAEYNCGAIPVGANGLLLTAIQAESRHPEFNHWFSECFRKVKQNYFPLTWRDNGFCSEGPGYAHYHKNPTLFGNAVRRTGGEDIIPGSGAVNAMHYLRHQWMPQGGCGPIGDNTEYGRRVFQSIYLHGIRELEDRAGLWTFDNFTDFDRINPLFIVLFYPRDLSPASPGSLNLRTSYYFEFDRNRSGTVFARSAWDDPQAAWFAFVTRYAESNHTHCDMNSFLFSAFGDQFATHANVYPYSHEHHGVDFEHNLIVVDSGGMPAADHRNSAGDDGSILGLLTGVGLGHFADYVRGDAAASYADRTVPGSTPADRADRVAFFAKQGPNPYVLIADDFRKDKQTHDYHWQWYTPGLTMTGTGTTADPFLVDGVNADCRISFLDPGKPEFDFNPVEGGSQRRPIRLGLLRVNRRSSDVRYLAIAIASRKGTAIPTVHPGSAVTGNPSALSAIVKGEGFQDLLVWQPKGALGSGEGRLRCGPIETDGWLAMVRTDPDGKLVGYVLGDGTRLDFNGTRLVNSDQPLSVSADTIETSVTGPRRAREGLAPLPAKGEVKPLDGSSRLLVDGQPLQQRVGRDGQVTINPPSSR